MKPLGPALPRRYPFAALLLLIGFGIDTSAARAGEQSERTPQFSRHVVPVLSRLGCNAGGACHGIVKGQNGFRLSLFGGQPALDFDRLTREVAGRRLNYQDPDRSLILLKATGQVSHGGGKRTEVGSSDYQVLRGWIAAGGQLDDVAKSQVTRLSVCPAEHVLKAGEARRFQVIATYADGTTADVSNLCRYEIHADEIASVDTSGAVRGQRVGDTVVIIRHGAEPVLASVLVVPGETKHPFDAKPHNFIDDHILAKLRAMDLPPSAICDDSTFLRRLYLDVTGYLPPPEEIRAFLADQAPDKRNKKIDEVLAKPGHAEVWAAKFSDLIKPVERGNDGGNNQGPGQVLRIRFYEWLRARLQDNTPYDRIVEKIFVSSSLEGRPVEQWLGEFEALKDELTKRKDKPPLSEPLLSVYNQRQTLDLYWEREGATGVSGALQFAHAFLGLRLQCAQCHRHPYDVWQQDDLLSFANFFTAMNTGGARKNSAEVEAHKEKLKPDLQAWNEELKTLSKSKEAADKTKAAQLQAKIAAANAPFATEVALLTSGVPASVSVKSPLGTQSSSVARLLGEKTTSELAPDKDRRQLVIDWLRRPDNPFFARAVVNRVWAHYLGRGLIDPPDNLSPLNPPSHPKLLDELCQGFIKSGYDLRWLHRTILQSRTYQQGHLANDANSLDRRNYARFQMRRLPGEVILDVLNQATGAKEKYPGAWMFRDGERAVYTAGVMVDVYNFYNLNDAFRYVVFGRQVRRTNVQCDCEQGNDVALPQLLFLANHAEVRQKIAGDNGRIAQLAKNKEMNNHQRVEELFLAALGRMPTADELKAGIDHIESSDSLRKGLEEVLWSLVNTREFQLNY
jgi:hypothetical protein